MFPKNGTVLEIVLKTKEEVVILEEMRRFL